MSFLQMLLEREVNIQSMLKVRLFILPSINTTDFDSNKVYYSHSTFTWFSELWFHHQEDFFIANRIFI
jgi:hypothetical protein